MQDRTLTDKKPNLSTLPEYQNVKRQSTIAYLGRALRLPPWYGRNFLGVLRKVNFLVNFLALSRSIFSAQNALNIV